MAATVCKCKRCGVEFVAQRRQAQWCSDRCKVAASRERSRSPVELPWEPPHLTAEIEDALAATDSASDALLVVVLRQRMAAGQPIRVAA